MSSTRTSLTNEISSMITRHIETLGQFVSMTSSVAPVAPESIVWRWERLNQICQYAPEHTSFDLYQEACECHDEVRSFLQVMNQSVDADFQDTYLGRILRNAALWRRMAAEEFKLSIDDVWQLISPACPDHLKDLGGGVYEAKWWMPVPVMDIEILKRTEGVLIEGEPFEPMNMPGGVALRFLVAPEGKNSFSKDFGVQ